MVNKLSQPLKYHGGKHYLADYICGFIARCPHLHFGETHYGGGAVLLRKPYANVSEAVNDVDSILMGFWAVLRDAAGCAELLRLVEATPVSEPQFDISVNELKKMRKDPFYLDCIWRAYHFFVVMRQSRQGLGKSFTTLSKTRLRRGVQESASSWLTAVEGLPEIHTRLKSVVIYSMDALAFIQEQDSVNTLFYCDPPYLPDTRSSKQCYVHEMTAEQHEELLQCLSQIRGKFILSGYASQLYSKYERSCGWNCEIIKIDNKSSSKKKKESKNEHIWYNF